MNLSIIIILHMRIHMLHSRLIALSIPSHIAVLQAIKSLPKDMVSLRSSPPVMICYDVTLASGQADA